MPAANSGRRRSRRSPSEDYIEETVPSQQESVDVVETDEHSQSRRSVKPERVPSNRRTREHELEIIDDHNEDNEVDEADEEDGRIDIVNFGDQPIDRKEGQKLAGIASDWSNMRRNVHEHAIAQLRELGSSMADAVGSDDKGEKALTELDVIMRDIIDIENEILAYEATLEGIHQRVMRGEEITNVTELYEQDTAGKLDQYNKQTSRQKYAKNKDYVNFKQAIYEAQHGDAMPPINDFVPKEDGDASDSDEDIEIGGVTQDYKCPLSLTTLVDPMTSRICSHSFSRSAITEYLQSKSRRATCPASGCRAVFGYNDLVSDKDLEKRVKAFERRKQRAEEDEEADEVID